MARRRPDPRQLSLLDLLDAAPPPFDPARWEGRPGETPADRALIEAGVADAYGLTALVRCGAAQHHPLVTLETIPCAASPS